MSLPDIKNFTGTLERGEAFVRAKFALVVTEGLSVHIKFTRARGRDITGYYRWNDRRMVLAVKRRLRYPRCAAYGVGTRPRSATSLARLPYRLVWHEERFDSPDHLLVFVAGHELWHFLCHSGQRKRDHETKANCNGFAWLREFRSWAGPGHAVEGIPDVPPRPDVVALPEIPTSKGAPPRLNVAARLRVAAQPVAAAPAEPLVAATAATPSSAARVRVAAQPVAAAPAKPAVAATAATPSSAARKSRRRGDVGEHQLELFAP